MESNLNKYLCKALNRYYARLEKHGNIDNTVTKRMLVLVFIKNFIEDYEEYFSYKDMNLISKAISCITNKDCVLPLYSNCSSLKHSNCNVIPSLEDAEIIRLFRLTEGKELRSTQDDNIRVVNSI
ncbi:MAG: hypothetical protein J6N78_04605 [Clostridia bacterium]|nr:hypothetical protein [Clostridia bacterium]